MATSHPATAGGMTPDMTALSPGMMGVADQGDATEMGQRMGKFMGSFMREMKNAPERGDANEGWRAESRGREPVESRRGNWRDDEETRRSGRGEQPREVLRYVPLYDPWGADRGAPYMEQELWGGSPYYGRTPYPGRGAWNEPGPYGWAADQNWERGRGYYGAGLAPWETHEPPPDPRTERRWLDPSYYDRPDPRVDPAWEEPPGQRPYGPWSGGGRRGSWW
ncbi:MAG: hypothetical protein HQL91_07580 [Magnetococcales bacterium]|nr:hypothetical protein [Magnetococcales bacterium]